MKSIAILNLKGGVGKTVTAVNVAAILAADYKNRVLLVDCDSQCNASQFYAALTDEGTPNLARWLTAAGRGSYLSYVQETALPGLSILPASDRLMDLDVGKISSGQVNGTALRALTQEAAVGDAADFVIFDCPPAFNAASAAALVAADEVIIPVKLDAFSLAGMGNLMRQVGNMRRINPALRVAGLLVTMWTRTAESLSAYDELKNYSGLHVYSTRIRRTNFVDSMTFSRQQITSFSPHSAAAIDYRRFVREYLGTEVE